MTENPTPSGGDRTPDARPTPPPAETPPPPAQPYPGEQYTAQPYPAQPYPAQQSPAQPYPAQPYIAQQNPAQPYIAQPYIAQPYPGQPYQGPAQLSDADARMWGMFAHLSGFVAGVFGLSFLGPLIIMIAYKDRSDFVRRHAVEALNFQITLWIFSIVGIVLSIATLGLGLIVFIPVIIVVAVAAVVFMILAAVAANRGEDYRYPLTLRLVK